MCIYSLVTGTRKKLIEYDRNKTEAKNIFQHVGECIELGKAGV